MESWYLMAVLCVQMYHHSGLLPPHIHFHHYIPFIFLLGIAILLVNTINSLRYVSMQLCSHKI